MASRDGIRPLDDDALAQVWGGVTFHPLDFIGPGAFGGNGPWSGSIPGFGPLPGDLSGVTVVTPHGQASHGGGTAQPDDGQDP